MTVAEQTKEVVELAAGYVNEIVTALTPIAKQAYEIGLLTLRIDAASVIIPSILGFSVASVFVVIFALRIRKIVLAKIAYIDAKQSEIREENKGKPRYECRSESRYSIASDYTGKDLEAEPFVLGVSIFVALGTLIPLTSAWLWVKLFSPELWLAHQAVEKLLK